MLIELVWGIHDGRVLTRSRRPPPFIWVDAAARLFKEPGEGRVLYRLRGYGATLSGQVERLVYRLDAHTVRCEGCGWFVPSEDACVLCEMPLSV